MSRMTRAMWVACALGLTALVLQVTLWWHYGWMALALSFAGALSDLLARQMLARERVRQSREDLLVACVARHQARPGALQ